MPTKQDRELFPSSPINGTIYCGKQVHLHMYLGAFTPMPPAQQHFIGLNASTAVNSSILHSLPEHILHCFQVTWSLK